MPSIGTRHRTDLLLVTTKITGPTTKFMFDPRDILKEVKKIADGENPPPPKELATEIAKLILGRVSYDPNVVHVDCEVLQHDGILYSDVAVLGNDGGYEEEDAP